MLPSIPKEKSTKFLATQSVSKCSSEPSGHILDNMLVDIGLCWPVVHVSSLRIWFSGSDDIGPGVSGRKDHRGRGRPRHRDQTLPWTPEGQWRHCAITPVVHLVFTSAHIKCWKKEKRKREQEHVGRVRFVKFCCHLEAKMRNNTSTQTLPKQLRMECGLFLW